MSDNKIPMSAPYRSVMLTDRPIVDIKPDKLIHLSDGSPAQPTYRVVYWKLPVSSTVTKYIFVEGLTTDQKPLGERICVALMAQFPQITMARLEKED